MQTHTPHTLHISHPHTDCFVVSQLFSVAKHKILEAGIETWLTHTPTKDSTVQPQGN